MMIGLHNAVFAALQRNLENWMLGLLARLTFASVLLFYFWHSGTRKLEAFQRGAEGGLLEHFTVSGNVFGQMAPKAFEAVTYDASALGTPYWIMAYSGTYAEFLLPLMIVIGFMTRIAAAGMIVFVIVQSYVDITGHGVDDKTIGMPFDRIQDSAIVDQRLLWVFPLVYLVVRGAGTVSLDHLFSRRRDEPAGATQ